MFKNHYFFQFYYVKGFTKYYFNDKMSLPYKNIYKKQKFVVYIYLTNKIRKNPELLMYIFLLSKIILT